MIKLSKTKTGEEIKIYKMSTQHKVTCMSVLKLHQFLYQTLIYWFPHFGRETIKLS
jgi:hypothetical protein